MQIHPDAPKDPYVKQRQDFVDLIIMQEKDMPSVPGNLHYIEISQHSQGTILKTILDIEAMCAPVLRNFSNPRNYAELQEKLYHQMRPHFDALNICFLRARTMQQSDYCAEKYASQYETVLKPTIKGTLLEY